jgi:hypothetical protein
MGRRMAVSLRTAKSGVTANSTATRKKEIPFNFKIAYLRIEFFPGQAAMLRTSVHVGPNGDNTDPCPYEWDRSGVNYFVGDASVVEFLNLTDVYPAGHKITAYYSNTDLSVDMTGVCEAVVEEA